MDFMECDTCKAKPGSPTLCAGCLNNRAVIGKLMTTPTARAFKGRAQLRQALADLLAVIAVDELIPESVSYMQQAWAALRATDET